MERVELDGTLMRGMSPEKDREKRFGRFQFFPFLSFQQLRCDIDVDTETERESGGEYW